MSQSEQADAVIRDHVAYSAVAAVVPIPFGDLLALTAVQLDLVKALANLYEQDFTTSVGKTLVASLTGRSLARIGASAAKAIPGVGAVGGSAIQVFLAGGSTYAVGHMFKAHFAAGGKLDTFNPERAREAYDKYVEKAKSHFSEAEEGPLRAEAVTRTLERLAVLRDAGDLTREEFNELKRKLIGRTA